MRIASYATAKITSDEVSCVGNVKNALVSLNSIFYVPATPSLLNPNARKIVTAGPGPNTNGSSEISCPINTFRIT